MRADYSAMAEAAQCNYECILDTLMLRRRECERAGKCTYKRRIYVDDVHAGLRVFVCRAFMCDERALLNDAQRRCTCT